MIPVHALVMHAPMDLASGRSGRCLSSRSWRSARWPGCPPSPGRPAPKLGGCRAFPATNAWNRDVRRPRSTRAPTTTSRSIGLDRDVHPDFGSGRYGDYGIPLTVVPRTQRRVPIRFTDYGDESDPGPYPIPAGARVEGGGDRHVLVVQRGRCRLYELFGARRNDRGGWDAASGAVFDLRSNRLRPKGWTSADAAGLPIAPGLARADEVRAGAIRHALRVTVPRTQKAYRAPARHFASSDGDPRCRRWACGCASRRAIR